MKRIVIYGLWVSLIFYSFVGCSISAMNKKPPPLPIDSLKEHPSRGELIALFGQPEHSEVHNEVRTDYFKFTDGYHGATKLRAIFYIAGDIFTLGLAELIFWPLEANTMIGRKGTATAKYDENDFAKKLEIYDEDGNPWDVNWKKGGKTAGVSDTY